MKLIIAKQVAENLRSPTPLCALDIIATNASSTLAIEDVNIQQQLRDFATVFANMPHQLPPNRDVDHDILEPHKLIN